MKEHPIGTRVRINCPGSIAHKRECTVVGSLTEYETDNDEDGVQPYQGQEVDVEWGGSEFLAFEPRELIPV
jgi:hypothetical protein